MRNINNNQLPLPVVVFILNILENENKSALQTVHEWSFDECTSMNELLMNDELLMDEAVCKAHFSSLCEQSLRNTML